MKGACIRALAPALLAFVVASCGTAAKPVASTPPSKVPAAVQPPLLAPLTLPVAVESEERVLVNAAAAELKRSQPQVSVTPFPLTATAASEQLLSRQPEMAVLAVSPPDAVRAQLGAAAEINIGVNRVWLGYDLPGVDALVLDAKTIAGIVSGKLSTWNAPEIAALNPSASLPPTPITISPIGGSSAILAILENYAQAPLKLGAVSTPRCATTIGCLDLTLSQPTLPTASALTSNQTATPPAAEDYPLASPMMAIIEPDPAHPQIELAAILLAIQLVEKIPFSPQQQADLARLASLSTTLSIVVDSRRSS